ncbi:LysR family transcriptional regulator [Rouxiella badensis]|jgi:DNA-binding transcriptional LysR family regulator|uniref:Transcriptional regulator n=1 Tax=Rouxiella badensis TaxID=1646377 RepID=A0A1X0WBD0_9GAMM|nr:LysR family transcriptional regulator [Rouxiella badensis]MCC3704802.1 LysR family transcriptional regulator [Rouxiella badensis]MCC3720998.1 LysR family transcriptional regulator [Rouxiella badensis]MCC3729553.1 LysR family transcriptional regulator [Rouxiella badensis]MCC3735420.1 LysR family transcriptional regulator [Rouxiella badensis]MCC3741221.1 LysR family transcriptional regulator [Rouxiella badensis]
MELRHLRYFVAVAETTNFTRAAERLGISQPPLSQQIQRLEHEVGTSLLRRLTRGVELTEAGQVLYEDARIILKLSDAALERTRSVARGMNGFLRIGFASSSAFNPQVFSLLHHYRDKYPGVKLEPQEKDMSALMTALSEGTIDLAFIRLPCERSKEFNLRVIDNEEMMVALPKMHPLSRGASVSLGELRNETLITFPRDLSPGLYDAVIAACEDAGFTPNLGQQCPQIASSLSMVATGFGYALVPASLSKIDADNVRCLPVSNQRITTQVALAWRRTSQCKSAQHLLNLITSARGVEGMTSSVSDHF